MLVFLGCSTNKNSHHIPAPALAIKGSILHFINNPFITDEKNSYEYFQRGVLLVREGKVERVGEQSEVVIPKEYKIIDYGRKLILPGFIDTHIHMPQTEMIASYGEQLLDWLNSYTFPTERKFEDAQYAKKISKIFINEMLKNGTTTALVFATVHPQSVDALLEEALKKNLRLVAGKVMMDNPKTTPEFLRDTAESSYVESKKLIEKWHHKGRLSYAVTPRFAITSTEDQLKRAGQLLKEHPSVYLHTHLSENKNEIDYTLSLFPGHKNYLDIYDAYGLLGRRSIFAHAVHLNPIEIEKLKKTEASVSFCPTSNLFLGSGLFNLSQLTNSGINIRVGLGTDIGAGTSFSQLASMNEAYKILQLQNQKLSALKAFYLATLGGARALDLDQFIGNFESGKEADFIVIDPQVSDLQKLRLKHSNNIEDTLFALATLGDDRNIVATYIMGVGSITNEESSAN